MIRETIASLPRLARRLAVAGMYLVLAALILYFPLWNGFLRQDKTLNVCVFVETFSYEAIEQFQKETGIKVNLTYAEIDEQTFAKFHINRGKDYDVVNVSDAFVYKLGAQDMLQAIDYAQIPNMSHVYASLKHLVYDVENRYAVPHKWYAYGIVYDRTFLDVAPDDMSWRYIFQDPQELYKEGGVKNPYRVCMVDDGRDASLLASLYLFGTISSLEGDHLESVKQMLITQKRWVEAYTLHSSQYFLFSGLVPVAAMTSNYMRKIYTHTDRFEFAIPKEGSLLIVENLVIPRLSKKIDLAHEFINFMLRDDIAQLNSKSFGYNSANEHANDHIDKKIRLNHHIFPDAKTFERLYIPLLMPEVFKSVEKSWLHVGFA